MQILTKPIPCVFISILNKLFSCGCITDVSWGDETISDCVIFVLKVSEEIDGESWIMNGAWYIIFIYWSMTNYKVYVWTVQAIWEEETQAQSYIQRVIIYIVSRRSRTVGVWKKERNMRWTMPHPLTEQNRTHPHWIERGVRERKMARACAQQMIDEDFYLRKI